MSPTPVAASLEMFAQNIVFLLGALLCLSFAFVAWFFGWTAAKMWLFRQRQKKSLREYRGRTRRADGQMYPPHTGGICDACGQVKKTVYHLTSGEKLCTTCYEPFWREAEGWLAPSAGADAPARQNRTSDGSRPSPSQGDLHWCSRPS
jgi:hypothetical protein